MSFPVRLHAVIRAVLLADWRGKYLALGDDLDVSQDSEPYNFADALSFLLEGQEAYAAQLTREMFPDTASSEFLARHAALIGMERRGATRAELLVAVTGTGTFSWATTDRLVDGSGALFAPTEAGSATTSGSLVVRAETMGAIGNLAGGTTLTWSPAPAGANPAASVDSSEVVARDDELDSDLAQRVLSWWRDRPGGGNDADWAAWVEERDEVGKAFVYPLRHASLGDGTLGATMVCVVGAVPTAVTDAGEPAASATRFLTGGKLNDIRDEMVGAGKYADTGGRAPSDQHPDDVAITTPSALATNVNLELTMGSLAPFPFAAPHAFASATDTSATSTTLPAGVSVLMSVFVAIPDPAVRGGYAYRVAQVGGTPGAYTWTWGQPLSTAPAPGNIRPLPSNAGDVRKAVLAIVDSLGPGLGTDPSARWPTADEGAYPATLYRGSLAAAAMGVPGLPGAPAGINGVISAVCTVPASDVTPTTEQLITLGNLTFTKA